MTRRRKRRNKKKKKVNNFILPAPFAGVIIIASACALIYVWLGCRCESLGRDIKALELERVELEKQLVTEEYRWARMKSPRNIERALEKYGIFMTWPRRNQIVRLNPADVFNNDLDKIQEDALKYAQYSPSERIGDE